MNATARKRSVLNLGGPPPCLSDVTIGAFSRLLFCVCFYSAIIENLNLFCPVLFPAQITLLCVLCCCLVYCCVLCRAVPCRVVLYCTAVLLYCCTVLHCTALHYIALHCTALHLTDLGWAAVHCYIPGTALHFTVLL